LTLRALHQSDRFAQAWTLLSDTYKRTVDIPDNVVLFPKRATVDSMDQCNTICFNEDFGGEHGTNGTIGAICKTESRIMAKVERGTVAE
jgi:hypothetical protein